MGSLIVERALDKNDFIEHLKGDYFLGGIARGEATII